VGEDARGEGAGAQVAGRVLALLEGHTDREDERAILELLRATPAADLDAVLRDVGMERLLGDVDDRLMGPRHASALLVLLARERLADLSTATRAELVLALQRGRTGSRAERAIVDVLVGTRGAELAELKAHIDASGDHHDLHQLLFHDIDDDALRAEALAHFAAEAAAMPAGPPCVLSDIDDTLYANWKDARYPKGTVYPGVLAFYRALGGALCFVTARPGDRAGVVEGHTLRMLRGRGVAATVLCGSFGHNIGNDRIAERKYDNFREYQRVYPERRFVFVGDSGQGDVAFGEMLLADPSGTVRAVFIHDVVNTPAARRAELAARGVHLFDTYAGAALAAHRLGVIDEMAVAAVLSTTQGELMALATLDAALREARQRDIDRDAEAIAARRR
jgi:hypothetical protein